jgi:xanthosine utilization system XapX-like protein
MWDTSNALLTALSALLGLLGIFVAGKAVDLGMQIFGGLLIAFAVVYIVGAIRRAYPHH